ncbi:hypothetical protein R3P38DRAFT_3233625 [Favolaschia claudopus]|uniref:Uncharacterized protein n=1 Tax=Favolaschia claudopus TaxID=2862362 RepID=A0AAV9ZHP2_9AGAR
MTKASSDPSAPQCFLEHPDRPTKPDRCHVTVSGTGRHRAVETHAIAFVWSYQPRGEPLPVEECREIARPSELPVPVFFFLAVCMESARMKDETGRDLSRREGRGAWRRYGIRGQGVKDVDGGRNVYAYADADDEWYVCPLDFFPPPRLPCPAIPNLDPPPHLIPPRTLPAALASSRDLHLRFGWCHRAHVRLPLDTGTDVEDHEIGVERPAFRSSIQHLAFII